MPKLSKAQIRDIFLASGFTIEEGEKDLKQYVYDAAAALLKAQAAVYKRSLDDAKNLPEEERRILKYYLDKQVKAQTEAEHAATMVEQLLGAPKGKPEMTKKNRRRVFEDKSVAITTERLAASPTYWFPKMEDEGRLMVTESGRKYRFFKDGYNQIAKLPGNGKGQFKSISQSSLQYGGAAVLAVFEHYSVVQITKNSEHFCYLVYERPDIFTIEPKVNHQHVSH